MKVVKYSKSDINKIDLGTKVIFKYPTPTKLFDIAKMVVKGRNPEQGFIIENDCQFVMYITKGNGKVFAGEEVIKVEENDVVFFPNETKFAIEGDLEYITVDVPAFYPEQSGGS